MLSTFTLENGVAFTYTDSGPVEQNGAYPTLFVIHGHTFHAGTFRRLHPLASHSGLRVICLNRREYDGSSLYPEDELAVFTTGTEEERAALLGVQGRDLALCIDGIIRSLALPKAGGVALMAWSLGNVFLLSVLASLNTLPAPTKERLVQWVHTAIIFQAPSFVFGVPPAKNLLVPQTDPTIPPAEKKVAFAKWVSSFFEHPGDLSTHDLSALTYPAPLNPPPDKTPTIQRMTPEEVQSVINTAPGPRYDDFISFPPYAGILAAQAERALWDVGTRKAWVRMNERGGGLWTIYATADCWNTIHAGWVLEDEAMAHPGLPMRFQVLEGANHFLMWEDPQRALDVFKRCMPVPTKTSPSSSAISRAGCCTSAFIAMSRVWSAIRRDVLRRA
ncbi:AB hydrolase-1 domain-containing protein [Mycena chlorophos]|uniref:AB hydrolase-1 domain-containing protein n=1 Tax=Mycena chlorophos TaxID=658473 RepID=A0A8H6S3X4_MYCCL|nr:AB hydrolase-1 domain-containing protein [Mycena chlorophos]